MKQPKFERRPLCPLAGFTKCRGERCMIWDDDWRVCSLNNGSLYSMVRAAVCDAAVEIGEAKGGTTSPDPAKAGPPSPTQSESFRAEGEGSGGGDEPRYPLPPLVGGGWA